MTTMLNAAMFDPDQQGVTRVRSAIGDDFAIAPATAACVMPDPPPVAAVPERLVRIANVDAGPLPPPARRYQRPSANWADRWITVSRP